MGNQSGRPRRDAFTETIAVVRRDGRVAAGEVVHAARNGKALCGTYSVGAPIGDRVVAWVDRDLVRDTRGTRPDACDGCAAIAPKSWLRVFRRRGRVGRPPTSERARLVNDLLFGALPEQREAGVPGPRLRVCRACHGGRDGKPCAKCHGRGMVEVVPRVDVAGGVVNAKSKVKKKPGASTGQPMLKL